MKRVLFLTNIPSPYRVKFYDELGKHLDVTVLFHDDNKNHTCRSAEWFGNGSGGFRQVHLTKRIYSRGEDSLCLDVIKWLKQPFDAIVICGYSSMTEMLAIAYLRMTGRSFYMEVDGGLVREESNVKYKLKKALVSAADKWISSGVNTTKYLVHYGAKADRVYQYPFSSLEASDILTEPTGEEEKQILRQELDMKEKNVVLAIGQFIHRKGFDVLLKAAASLDEDTGVYIVGGEPTEEYLQMVQELNLKNIHFVGFVKKDRLALYYKAADLFVLPTREDIWGLVIGEAMAYGLPVITTDRCVAGLELVENGVSGYIIPVEDVTALADSIQTTFLEGCCKMGAAALEKIRPYTIEHMVDAHVRILKDGK